MTLTQITEKGIKDGEIIDADINSSAEIAVNKLANGTARQLLQTAANGTDVEFTSNVALPGTLHVASNGNIAGTLGSGNLTITSAAPFISFLDTDHNSDFNIQHYNVNEGFNYYHFERSDIFACLRNLVFMTYLNDVEDGGTQFKYQNLITPAKKGLTIIWPTDFTHTHRGVISQTKEKYIVTGWYSYTPYK